MIDCFVQKTGSKSRTISYFKSILFLYTQNSIPIMIQESNTVTGSDDEQVTKVIEELQLLDQLDKLINASEVSYKMESIST